MTEHSDTSPVLEWKEPPPPHGSTGASRWPAVADELRAHPGEWALIVRDGWTSRMSQFQRSGSFGPGFEFTTRSGGYAPGHSDIYARFVGEQS